MKILIYATYQNWLIAWEVALETQEKIKTLKHEEGPSDSTGRKIWTTENDVSYKMNICSSHQKVSDRPLEIRKINFNKSYSGFIV